MRWGDVGIEGNCNEYVYNKSVIETKKNRWIGLFKVIREKSCGEGSLIGQDTIENVSEPKFFF